MKEDEVNKRLQKYLLIKIKFLIRLANMKNRGQNIEVATMVHNWMKDEMKFSDAHIQKMLDIVDRKLLAKSIRVNEKLIQKVKARTNWSVNYQMRCKFVEEKIENDYKYYCSDFKPDAKYIKYIRKMIKMQEKTLNMKKSNTIKSNQLLKSQKIAKEKIKLKNQKELNKMKTQQYKSEKIHKMGGI